MLSIGSSDDERKGRMADASSGLEPLTVTVATARQITGLSNTTVYDLIKKRKIDVIKVGTRTLITYASLKALLQPSPTT